MEQAPGTTGTAAESSDSNGNSGGSGGSTRGNVIVKSHYGTELFPPDTECGNCSSRAVGVLVKEKRVGGNTMKDGKPLCGVHRDRFRKANMATWEEYEFRRFVDQ